MNVEKYLQRINYRDSLVPNLNVLKNLQKTHLLQVPFENLDIHYGHPIDLNIDKIYEKVVDQERGGFCYELNGLFHVLLQEIGFNSKMISARVYDSKKEAFGKEFDHLALIVAIDAVEYLVDVGFGEFVFYPLKLELDRMQADPRGNFIIKAYKNEYFGVSKFAGTTESKIYIFSKKERQLDEFSGMCSFHQTSPDSHFTQKKIISKPIEDGRISIAGNSLKITKNGMLKSEVSFPIAAYKDVLMKWFNMDEKKLKARNNDAV